MHEFLSRSARREGESTGLRAGETRTIERVAVLFAPKSPPGSPLRTASAHVSPSKARMTC
jgi:hypothetical protein